MLDGTGATVDDATPWGGAEGQPAGYRLEYRWPAAAATGVDEEWPLLRSDAATPEPPYDSADYRIRASDVTALQVDVLLRRLARDPDPAASTARRSYVLEEQTWPPFCWFPWFTARPWVLCAGLRRLVGRSSWCAPGGARAPGTAGCRR